MTRRGVPSTGSDIPAGGKTPLVRLILRGGVGPGPRRASGRLSASFEVEQPARPRPRPGGTRVLPFRKSSRNTRYAVRGGAIDVIVWQAGLARLLPRVGLVGADYSVAGADRLSCADEEGQLRDLAARGSFTRALQVLVSL